MRDLPCVRNDSNPQLKEVNWRRLNERVVTNMESGQRVSLLHPLQGQEDGEKVDAALSLCKSKLESQEIVDESNGTLCISESGIIFSPPLYLQRYQRVIDKIISVSKGTFRKAADLGCAELKFFKFLKNVPGIQEIILLDKDASTLKDYEYRIKPLVGDFLFLRKLPLNVKAVCGDARKYDPLLAGTQVVTMIELIEHMHESELPKLVECVFKDISPKLVIITTPNADFNKFIPGRTSTFRHWDHKFEWTATEFYQWCQGILEEYGDYYLEISGCGLGPENTYCTQMATFLQSPSGTGGLLSCIKKDEVTVDNSSRQSCVYTEEIAEHVVTAETSEESWVIISEFDYPYDLRTQEEQDRAYTLGRFFDLKIYLRSSEQSQESYKGWDEKTEVDLAGEKTEDKSWWKLERRRMMKEEVGQEKEEDSEQRSIEEDPKATRLDELPLRSLSLKNQCEETCYSEGSDTIDKEQILFYTENVTNEEVINQKRVNGHEYVFYIVNHKYAVIPMMSLTAWVNKHCDQEISSSFISLALENECFETSGNGDDWQGKLQLWDENISSGEDEEWLSDEVESSHLGKLGCDQYNNVSTTISTTDEDWDRDEPVVHADPKACGCNV
ncbi:uncharacterized protein [Procambarus clarkii]|uniref:uncharacterized protein isoform X1 n=1 Tax=Procambarus clarkii TaxID=6728 RepID=UPI00374406DE